MKRRERRIEGLGERIKALREERGLTQAQISSILDITDNGYRGYEKNTREPPLKILVILSDYYNITIDFILKGQGA